MARKDNPGRQSKKRPRTSWSQILFTVMALIVIAAFVLSLLAN